MGFSSAKNDSPRSSRSRLSTSDDGLLSPDSFLGHYPWPSTSTVAHKNYETRHMPDDAEKAKQIEAFYRDLVWSEPSKAKDVLRTQQGPRAPKTCEWIMDAPELKNWLEPGAENKHILWISGNYGRGKSTMAVYLAEKLTSKFTNDAANTCAYFFCDSKDSKRNTVQGILRGLLSQLFQNNPHLLNDRIRRRHVYRGARVFEKPEALWNLLVEVAYRSDRRIFCIIDGLDECDAHSRTVLLELIEQTFHGSRPSAKLNLLVLSRPSPKIYEYLGEFVHRDLDSFPQSKNDVEIFIDQRVQHIALKRGYSGTSTTQVKRVFQAKCEYNFQWVRLASENICKLRPEDAVKYLKGLPNGSEMPTHNSSLNQKRDNFEHIGFGYTDEDREKHHARLKSPFVSAILTGRVEMLAFLLNQGAPLTPYTIRAAARWGSPAMLQTIMTIRRNEISRDQDLSCSAAECASANMMNIIFTHPSFRWSDAAMTGAIRNEHNGLEILELLFKLHGNDIELDEWMMGNIAGICHPRIMDYLLTEHGSRIEINAAVAEKAIENRQGPAMLRILLKHRPQEGIIDEDLMTLALANNRCRPDFMAIFVELPRTEVEFTKEVVLAAIASPQQETDDWAPEVLEMLLSHRAADVDIDEEIVMETLLGLGYPGLQVLLEYKDESVRVTQALLDAAAGVCSAKEFRELVGRAEDDFQITQDMLINTTLNARHGDRILPVMLGFLKGSLTIGQEALGAFLQVGHIGFKSLLILLLRDRGCRVSVTRGALRSWIRDEKICRGSLAFLLVALHSGWCKLADDVSGPRCERLEALIKHYAELEDVRRVFVEAMERSKKEMRAS
ncbi:vegetative incompatibility het-e-1 [Fusarium heterosporum]|uniref:Vegetative incompatibility het-e-1 n=1 Tax=Fusarium heterosporum TaxID=42747 RepID=A0A8H5TBS2_FUSHE|nr:vegetative incompatibility het-e-1 [Fusarium heterosporum]